MVEPQIRVMTHGDIDFVMRLQELAGGEARTVRVGFDPSLQVTGAAMADMLERRGDKLPLDPDGTISVPIGGTADDD